MKELWYITRRLFMCLHQGGNSKRPVREGESLELARCKRK